VATNTFISFPPAPLTAAAAPVFPALTAAPGSLLTPQARERVMARTRLVQMQRLRGR
jgi:hypothetical protein